MKRLPLFDLNKQFKTCRFRFNVHGKYRLIAIVDAKTFTVWDNFISVADMFKHHKFQFYV